jgi:hypothetical protein
MHFSQNGSTGSEKRAKCPTGNDPFWKMVDACRGVIEDIIGYVAIYPSERPFLSLSLSLSLFYMKSFNHRLQYLSFFLIAHFKIQVLLAFLEIGDTFATASYPHFAFRIIWRLEDTFTLTTSEVADLHQYLDK